MVLNGNIKGKKYVIGDCHGAFLALKQCLELVNFNYENDTLIQLGDVVDGFEESFLCVEELLKIKNLISLKGNHDQWFLEFIETGIHFGNWEQGGFGTLKSYCDTLDKQYYNKMSGGWTTNLLPSDLPQSHIDFFKNQLLYYIDENRNCFVHGGFNRHKLMSENEAYEPHQFYWDRDLWMSAMSHKGLIENGNYDGKFKIKENFKEVFIGHTSTVNWNYDEKATDSGIIIPGRKPITTPMKSANIYNLDTGAGFKGKLTIMDIDTHEYWQSDFVQELYPGVKGRN